MGINGEQFISLAEKQEKQLKNKSNLALSNSNHILTAAD